MFVYYKMNSSVANSSYASNNRQNTLKNLEIEYNRYIEEYQGMFVVKCQMANQEFKQILESNNLVQMIQEFPNFTRLQKEIKQEKIFKKSTTLVIDLENTLLTKIEILNKQELD